MSTPVAAKVEPQEDDDELQTKKARGAGIKTCITCMRSSNEANPVTDGPRKSWSNWPWAHGCNAAPIGKQRRICALVFVLSGFSKSYAGVKELHKAMKSSKNTADSPYTARSDTSAASNSPSSVGSSKKAILMMRM